MSVTEQEVRNEYLPPIGGNGRPTPVVSHIISSMKGLDFPPRGDREARRWFLLGVLAYAVLFVALAIVVGREGASFGGVATLVGLGGSQANWLVFVLAVLGIVLTGYAFLTILRDARLMKREEDDVEWVQTRGRAGLDVVFVPLEFREKIFQRLQGDSSPEAASAWLEKARVETLVDDRVRRVRQASSDPEAAHVSAEELRAVAEQRTARFGAFARYAVSLLLLLAVLGTFAGVKTALPGLIEAMTNDLSLDSLRPALESIAAAFGGNALALVGAIAVGIAAQGMAFGRRNLLERLELLSTEHIYRGAVSATANPLLTAVQSLSGASMNFRAAADSITGVQEGIGELADRIAASFRDLEGKLSDIVGRQEEGLYTQTHESLDALQHQVADLAAAVAGSMTSRAMIMDAVKSRADEARGSLERMDQSRKILADAVEHLKALSQSVSAQNDASTATFNRVTSTLQEVQRSTDALAKGSSETAANIDQLRAAMVETTPALAGLSVNIGGIANVIREGQEGTLGVMREIGGEVAVLSQAGVREAAAASASASAAAEAVKDALASFGDHLNRASSRDASNADVLRLLREIAARQNAPNPDQAKWSRLVAGAILINALFVSFGIAYTVIRVMGW